MKKIVLDIKKPSVINELCGTKATALVELKNMGIPVPDFYAISILDFNLFCEVMGIGIENIYIEDTGFNKFLHDKNKFLDIIDSTRIYNILPEGDYMVRSSSIPINDIDICMFPSMVSGAFGSYYAANISEINNSIFKVWESTFSKKAYEQCKIFSNKPIIAGMGVVIQKYINPIISGVMHAKKDTVSINWVLGHLSKIVNGEILGNSIIVYKSKKGNYILRGLENNILVIKNKKYENIFKLLWDIAETIYVHFKCTQEIEWLYDGEKIWIVQSQPLFEE